MSLASVSIKAQDFEDLYKRLNTFDKSEQYDRVDLETSVVVDFILSEPIVRKSPTRKYYFALMSMMKWMDQTENYKILLFERVYKACGDDGLMKNRCIASMGKYLLDQCYKNNRHVLPVKRTDINYGDLPEVKETLLEGANLF